VRRERAFVYLLIALALLAAALLVRVSRGNHGPAVPAVRGGAAPRRPNGVNRRAEAAKGAYALTMDHICDTAARVAATLPVATGGARREAAVLRAWVGLATPIERKLAAVSPPAVFAPLHAKLVAQNHAALGALRTLAQRLAHGGGGATRAAADRLAVLNRESDQSAAAIGLLDCLTPDGTDAHNAFPPAPKTHGRTRLSWPEYDRAIDGICADNSARTVYGSRLIEGFHQRGASARLNARWRLRDGAYQRLYRLVRRMGRPPDGTRPYRAWLERVRDRTRIVHRQARAAFYRRFGVIGALDPLVARLDAEENWFGAKMGLRVCSAHGPARPPGSDAPLSST
jgi:hypothetical protein